MAAVFLPVLVLLFAIAIPLGWVPEPSRDRVLAVAGNPLAALVLLGVCALALFHWAQRFRYTLFDGLKLKAQEGAINVTVYTLAVAGGIAAVVVLWQAVSARAG